VRSTVNFNGRSGSSLSEWLLLRYRSGCCFKHWQSRKNHAVQ